MDEEASLCVGICQADPDTGLCIGCGRQFINFGPCESAALPAPEMPVPAAVAPPDLTK